MYLQVYTLVSMRRRQIQTCKRLEFLTTRISVLLLKLRPWSIVLELSHPETSIDNCHTSLVSDVLKTQMSEQMTSCDSFFCAETRLSELWTAVKHLGIVPDLSSFTSQTKGTSSFGKRRNKTHTLCRRCGSKAYHLQKSSCGKCGYPEKRKRKCKSPSGTFYNKTLFLCSIHCMGVCC